MQKFPPIFHIHEEESELFLGRMVKDLPEIVLRSTWHGGGGLNMISVGML